MLRTSPLPVTHLGAGDRPRTLTWAMSSTSAEPPIDIATHYVRPHVATAGRTCPAGAGPGGPLDPDQADRPEPAQPVQQAGITSGGCRELPDAEQPADRIKRGGHMHVRVGVHAAGDSACLYDGQRHPFPWLRDGTHPLAAGP